ncbi:hypothetical protein ACLGIH_05740 [Streptomyces sp. HMX87]|uniref:hypothetical protein n=1 Tax=Streptomyces sp. HMX87 TaxID=3390849 RepID=UPI003A8390F9
MRRTARALSAALLASAALGTSAAPGLAAPGAGPEPPVPVAPEHRAGAGEPAAEVSPATVEPGGTVTVSVSCPATGGPAPAGLDATSQAFDEGTVELRKVPGNDDKVSGPAYRGTARLAPAENFEGDPDAVGPDSAWTVDGTCPAAPGGEGKPWSATITVSRVGGGGKPCPQPARPGEHCPAKPAPPCPKPVVPGGHCPTKPPCPEPVRPGGHCPTEPPCPEPAPHHHSCATTAHPHGVRAGAGGAFTDSVPALVAGGLFLAGAGGLAAHRLLRGRGTAHR